MNVSGSHLSKEFFELVKAIGESRSKQEEDRIIVGEVTVLKQRLSEPNVSPKKMKEYLVRAVYVEMLGHDASFSYIHGVKLAHEKQLLCKRMGYLACNLFLHRDHELMLLLINTIQRDLSSPNHLEVSAALTCVCHLVNQEMQPAIFPLVKKLIGHSNEVVRKKACMALHTLYSIQPDSVYEIRDVIRRALCDPDPSVMGSSLHVLHELAKTNPSSCKDLVPSLVSILKQICEHRLHRDYDYHRMPAPWIQVKLLSMLATLGAADKKASEQMYETLQEVMRKADAGVNVGYAIIYECVKTITAIYPSHALLELAASSISRFISADNHNLKYVGVTGLGWIVQVNAFYASEHQLVVVDCLEDPDETLKRKTLDLLYRMTNPKNVTVIVDKLAFHLRTSVDQHLRSDLASKITFLAERYAPNNHWYLDAMATVLELAGSLVPSETAHSLTTLIAEVPADDDKKDEEFRVYAANKFVKLFENIQSLPDILVQIASWVLGEYGSLCTLEGYTDSDEIVDLLCDCIDRTYEDSSTRGWILSAITKLCAAGCGTAVDLTAPQSSYITCRERLKCYSGVKSVIEKLKMSQNTTLQQKCYELQVLLEETPEAIQYILPYDASSEDIHVNEDLPFLDEFVNKAMACGARRYIPPSQRPSKRTDALAHGQELSQPHGLNFTPYDAPRKAMPLAELPSAFDSEMSRENPSVRVSGLMDGGEGGRVGERMSERSCEFHVQGPRRWGPSGYVTSATDSASSRVGGVSHASAATSSYPSTGSTQYPSYPASRAPRQDAHPAQGAGAGTRELTDRERTAAALFSGLGIGEGERRVNVSAERSFAETGNVMHAAERRSSTTVDTGVRGYFGRHRGVTRKASGAQDSASTSLDSGSDVLPCAPVSATYQQDIDLLDFDTPGAGMQKWAGKTEAKESPTMDVLLSLDVSQATGVTVQTKPSLVLEPFIVQTAEVGAAWNQLQSERRGTVCTSTSPISCEAFLGFLRTALSMHIVEVIGAEGIVAGKVRESTLGAVGSKVFVHCKVSGPRSIDIIVKTTGQQISEEIFRRCSVLQC